MKTILTVLVTILTLSNIFLLLSAFCTCEDDEANTRAVRWFIGVLSVCNILMAGGFLWAL